MCEIDEKRFQKDFEEISKFGALDGGGLTRLAFSSTEKDAREWLIALLESREFSVRVDSVGNIYARFDKNASDKSLAPVSVGSHIDSVPNGGFYDGTLGVMAGVEAISSLKDTPLKRPLEIIVFACEESSRFKMATVGSKIVAGKLGLESLKSLKDSNGVSLYSAMRDFGLSPDDIESAKLENGAFHSYLELHIEQGRVLESAKIPVGIVTGIAAPIRFEVIIKGRADHSGATPMGLRSDALVASSRVILEINALAKEYASAVATVGYARCEPGVLNVIPGQVSLGVDIRDIDEKSLNELNDRVRNFLETLSKELEFSYEIRELAKDRPVKLSEEMVEILSKNAEILGIKSMKMPSGAGHDAMHMDGVAGMVGMIFIPCKDGISHNVNENIEFRDAFLATKLLTKTLKDLAS